MWKNGSTAPPINIQRSALRATFHVHVRKLVHSCNITIPTKKSRGTKSETKQDVGYLNFSRHICVIFAIFRCHTLTDSSKSLRQIYTKMCHYNLKPFVKLNCEDLEFSWKGLSVTSCQISMIRHETGSCYNSGIMSNLHQTSHV